MASDQSDKTSILILAAAAVLIAVVIGVSVVVWQAVGAQTAQQAALAEAARTMQAEQSAAEAAQRVQQSQQLAEAEAKGLKAAEEQIQKLQAELAAERKDKELAIAGEEAIANILVEILQSPNPTRDGRDVKVVELLDTARYTANSTLKRCELWDSCTACPPKASPTAIKQTILLRIKQPNRVLCPPKFDGVPPRGWRIAASSLRQVDQRVGQVQNCCC